ncbi:MAG: DEAD/DEAH box helicase [Nanoarchaeota archaeon]|nr:DEAD/DEAH box helicase [Nanoarchaeota archaeon]MBU4283526.1 DEAD/DEAH box helicase [Nanoarchaeota archaeon]MBU4493303.1 DEAD/DEAH box helicase [Nanoarchaeota archaeon]
MNAFNSFKFSDELMKSIEELGFDSPTQIQSISIPYILQGKDVIGESETGSGKTLAFGSGIVEKTIPGKGLQALVITPTRELAEQVKKELIKIAVNKKLNIISVYGGVAINPQIYALRTAEVVIATPGRFKDHLQRRTVDTSRIKLLVLDEADKMLDMGFVDDIEDIIKTCPRDRQTLFFSATIPPRIEELSNKYMRNPVNVSGKKQVDPSKLKQFYYSIPKNFKLSLLLHLVKKEDSKLIMVFCNTRRTTDFVVKNLKVNGINAIAIHGGFTQNKRDNSMENFKKGNSFVLVCTDVASRGLHIDYVSHIYNYEIPKNPIDYVHRIGRTARAGEEGKVINLLCDDDYGNFSRILNEYRAFDVKKMEKPYVEKIKIVSNSNSRGNYPRRNTNNIRRKRRFR